MNMAQVILLWPFKDPNEVEDFFIDWAGTVAAPGRTYGDPIVSSTWIVPVGITKDSDSFDAGVTTIWLSGGTVGDTLLFTNRVVTAGNRTYDQSVKLKIKAK